MRKAIRVSAITAAANMSTSPKIWRSIAPSGCSAAISPMCSRIPARQANQGVFLALAQPGDTILGMSLDAGGHLTHGAAPNLSGKWFKPVQYGVRRDDCLHRFRSGRGAGARSTSPASSSLAARPIRAPSISPNSARLPTVSARIFMVDMAHFAGLVAAGVHPSPLPPRPCRDDHDA